MQKYRLGIDIGGTFTDVMVASATGSILTAFKIPSIPRTPEQAIFEAVERLGQTGIDPKDIDLFVHGTTLGVNTLIERNGAATGLLVTRGFRDLLEIRRLRLPNAMDFNTNKPLPLVPRHLVAEIDERCLPSGQVIRMLNEQQVRDTVQGLVNRGVTAIAVCFLHAYRNPAHEQQTRDLIRREFPQIFVCTSTDLWPQQREYERGLVSVMNAYIGARMQSYFQRLETGARQRGFSCQILSTKSNGGIMTVARAAEEPVHTLLSGPASGVIGAAHVARQAGFSRVVALDMGGTSADVGLIVEGHPSYSTENQIGDFPVITAAVDVSSIGAGGGSIAWTDSAGVLRVGPRSAGADPGPACYGRGGESPTVTDAYVEMGIIAPDRFLGGTMSLEPSLATRALDDLGRQLGLSPRATAQAILDITTSNMYAQFTPLMARKGIDPRDFVLLAYGGAGPTHAFLLAKEVGISKVLIPVSPGTLCALGCLVADLRNDFVVTVYKSSYELTDESLSGVFADLNRQAQRWLKEEKDRGVTLQSAYRLYSADMRYEGQAFEIDVPIASNRKSDLAEVVSSFHKAYHAVFGFSDPEAPVSFINLRATVVGVTAKVSDLSVPRRPNTPENTASRSVFYGEQSQQVRVLPRAQLPRERWTEGPAIIEQYDTTIFLTDGYRAMSDEHGNLIGEAVE